MKRPRQTLRQVLVVLILMLGSYAVGFALVISFDDSNGRKHASNVTDTKSFGRVSATPDVPTLKTAAASAAVLSDEAEAPREVPAGPSPEGAAVSGAPLYLWCRNADGDRQAGNTCDSLAVLEKRFANRLYVVDECKRRYLGAEAEGILSLGVNVDFAARSVRFWAGPSSSLEQAKAIAVCIRERLAGLPLYDIRHAHDEYRLFFTVDFMNPGRPKREQEALRRRGREVEVTKDFVRIRRMPPDGYVLGKVMSGHHVTLVGRKDVWCRVISANHHDGWMICDALAL